MNKLKAFVYKPWAFAALASLVTVLLVGGVAVAVTPLGCQVGQKIGVGSPGPKCPARTAAVVSPGSSPLTSATPTVSYAPPPVTASAPQPTPLPVPSPTRNPAYPPYQYDASGAYPPIYEVSSQPQPATVSLKCRLPIYANGSGSGGFLEFPGGQFTPDPRSAVTAPPPPAGYTPPPGYYGGPPSQFFGLTYSATLARWLPVPRSWITPDGKRYAYAYPGADGVYVVTIATGAETEVGEGQKWTVLDAEAEGIYVTPWVGGGQPAAGLWLLPFTGPAKLLTATGYWTAVGGGAAYGTATSAVPNGAANTILRLDLSTGKAQPWFTAANAQSSVLGFDAKGAPVIQDYFTLPNAYPPSGTQIWIVPGLAQGYVIANNPPFGGAPVADSHGLWFPGGQTFLFVPGQGTFVASQVGGNLAGICA